MDPPQDMERNDPDVDDIDENVNKLDTNEAQDNNVSNTSPCSVDNSKTVINKIANLYAERLMSDVCLVVGNVSLNHLKNRGLKFLYHHPLKIFGLFH